MAINKEANDQKYQIPKDVLDDLDGIVQSAKINARLLQIVEAAARLFHQRGYASTTTRDIGNACNISPGHLYYYIKSKEDFVEIFKKIQESDLEEWEKIVRKMMKRLPPEELLIETVREYISYIHAKRRLAIFWYDAFFQLSDEQRAGIVEIETRTINLFKEIIELGCKAGQFHVKDPFVLACNVYMMCATWALKRYLLRQNYTVEQYTDICIELITATVRSASELDQQKLSSA